MPTDLAAHLDALTLIDTHEHLMTEKRWTSEPHDLLSVLFMHYTSHDLLSAGASAQAVERALDASDPDIEARFAGIEKAWQAMALTGYGQAVSILARELFHIEHLTARAIREAEPSFQAFRQPGQRLHILRDLAGLDHVQIDNFIPECPPDLSGPDFFLYDINMGNLCNGMASTDALFKQSGVTVTDLTSLGQAIDTIFARHAPCAIAVKSQHAYARTLRWEKRSDQDAQAALTNILQNPDNASEADRLCVGDFCLDRIATEAAAHHLPVKLHTGYYANNDKMPVDRIRPGNLTSLLMAHPQTRFVLMHAGYPYSDEMIALAKHFSNVWVDLCWAWSINPYHSADFVRRYLHAAPANKLFGFGGDAFAPLLSYAYARQSRRWLTRALQGAITDGDLSETQAIDVANRLMRQNALELFDIEGTRQAIGQAIARGGQAEGSTA